jgi:CheY-like chemotaxis protein
VFGIVRQHRGAIQVWSELGHGTTFEILLPAVEPEAEPAGRSSAPTGRLIGTERILVVEDDPDVRMLTRAVLERNGYSVLTAATGVDGLRRWEDQAGRIELLLTDMVMPGGVSGQDLAEKLRTLQPGLKVIFTSGYSADLAGRELRRSDGQDFLQKPYSPQQLLRAIRRMLDG